MIKNVAATQDIHVQKQQKLTICEPHELVVQEQPAQGTGYRERLIMKVLSIGSQTCTVLDDPLELVALIFSSFKYFFISILL